MTYSKNVLSLLSLALLLLTPTLVLAYGNLNEGYQEVSYDDLVSELNAKKTSLTDKQKKPLNEIHLGVGYVHSFSQMNIKNTNTQRSQNGLELSASMNLDSPNLYAEGLLRNFSGSTLPQEDLQIFQADARLGFIKELAGMWKYNLVTGFSGRFVQASNATSNYSVNEFTPCFTAGGGVIAEIHKDIRLGFEAAGRTSIMGRNTDKNSVDLTLRMETSL